DEFQVLFDNERDGNIENVELVILDEREKQVERTLERGELDRERFLGLGFHRNQPSFMAARTLTMVSSATARALAVPSCTSSSTRASSSFARASRCLTSAGMSPSSSIFLQSTQPMPALRHSRSTSSTRSGEL